MRILLVDDEIELTNSLARALEREGYVVDVAYDGQQGCQRTESKTYDLLVLDWMLPKLSGLEICQSRRSHGDTTPVLFLTAKDTLDDRVAGLDAGADDYLVKPFELRELLARVRALLRRSQQRDDDRSTQHDVPEASHRRLKVEDLELDCDNQLGYRGGRTIELSEKETRLLAYFMQHPGQLLTHLQIQAYLWGTDTQPSSNVLAASVRLLRRKVSVPGESPLIHNVYGKGYRFGIAPDSH
ncbi:MAG: response regulator transcription factor [Cyanobacteria bacterium SID2]|nr:response regulator transcription factor [Cyanobacteria bacterium SID2]MBP0005217.1 response regulator transcription factor [Cyanobacteria bacterium SBC]